MNNTKGFTMVELLVVLVIVAILAAVATPIYMANVQRAKASEAVSHMALIRQALRDYQINSNTYFDIDSDEIQLLPPPVVEVTFATGEHDNPAGVNVNAGVSRFFSNAAFTVEAVNQDEDGASGAFTAPNTVNFLITADGSKSVKCEDGEADNCATNYVEVKDYRIEMDNSGRTMISYDSGATWQPY
jgi:prepilin-type N-terminal cleavage/methylation domain-containing protein